MSPPEPPADAIAQALAALSAAIEARLRAEQLRNRLTGLANDDALTELLESSVEEAASGHAFWAAFIEVDHFKSINDEFSYQDADQLLERISDRLRHVAKDYFPAGAVPIRAHGDEFFLVGARDGVDAEQIQKALESLRSEIALIRIGVRGKPRPIQCTVSIGWLLSEDAQQMEGGLTDRSVRGYLELAVARAKIPRNAVVRFSAEMRKTDVRHDRADCGTCGTKFSLAVPVGKEHPGDLACPNCRADVSRPPTLENVPVPGLSG